MNPRPGPSDGALQLILLLAFLIPAVIFLISQQNALKIVKPENRSMRSGLVWLQLTPIFANIGQFFVIPPIAGSLKREMASRHNDSIFGADALVAEGGGNRPTQGIGVTYCILDTLIILLEFSDPGTLETFRGLVSLAMITCWIIYWVQLAQFKNKLKRLPA